MIIFTMILISVVAFQSLNRSRRYYLLLFAGAHRHLNLRELLMVPRAVLVAELLGAFLVYIIPLPSFDLKLLGKTCWRDVFAVILRLRFEGRVQIRFILQQIFLLLIILLSN